MTLLARYAECVFWMARYVERAENLARILDVQETFSRDASGAQNWLSIVQLNADEEAFYKRYGKPTGANVSRFYVVDGDNPTSILASIASARDNARTLRPLISTEMWAHLNVFYNRLKALKPEQVSQPELGRVCAMIKEACQAHTGITEGTFFRDQSWYFYQLGRLIERADQTTRLLDIKYHLLLPSHSEVGGAVDVAQWNAVLRSAAGYHAYRRIHPSGMSPAGVAGFLLMNDAFPRSVALCINNGDQLLHQLKTRFMMRGGNGAMELLDEMRAVLSARSIEEVLRQGLHEFLDWIQLTLGQVTSQISHDFFGGAIAAQAKAAGQGQGQRQSQSQG